MQITKTLKTHFYTLSLQKFSSNVVDKCIFRLNKACINILILSLFGTQNEIDQKDEDSNELSQVQLSNLILNEFANFVVKNLFNRNK